MLQLDLFCHEQRKWTEVPYIYISLVSAKRKWLSMQKLRTRSGYARIFICWQPPEKKSKKGLSLQKNIMKKGVILSLLLPGAETSLSYWVTWVIVHNESLKPLGGGSARNLSQREYPYNTVLKPNQRDNGKFYWWPWKISR